MGSEGIIEITDFYLAIAADRVSAMTTAAARNLHCKKSELLDWRDGLRRLGLRVVGPADFVDELHLEDGEAFDNDRLCRAIAAGADSDSEIVVWDTRRGQRNVYRLLFDGAGGFRRHWIIDDGVCCADW
jgi:hypothetical protein